MVGKVHRARVQEALAGRSQPSPAFAKDLARVLHRAAFTRDTARVVDRENPAAQDRAELLATEIDRVRQQRRRALVGGGWSRCAWPPRLPRGRAAPE